MLKELCRIDMRLSSYPKVLYELSKLPEPQKKAAFRAYARMDLFFLLRYCCGMTFMTEGVRALNGPTPKSFLQKSTKLKEFSTQDELSALDLTEEIAEILDDPRKAGSRKVEAERQKWEALEEQTRTARWYWSRCWDVQQSPNGHLDLQVPTWTYRQPSGAPNGHLQLQMATWSSKQPPAPPNGHLELQMATWTTKQTISWSSQ